MLNENPCGTVLGDRSLQWHIAMEKSIFRYLEEDNCRFFGSKGI